MVFLGLQKRLGAFIIGMLSCVVLTACEDAGSEKEENSKFEQRTSCYSGKGWSLGGVPSDLMHPGRDCIRCHTEQEIGPRYEIAGTIFKTLVEEDDCVGLEGATIEIIDYNKKVFTMSSNSAGNFYMTDKEAKDIKYPATVKAIFNGKENPMLGLLPYGNCADCHTRNGNWTAEGGRVFVKSD